MQALLLDINVWLDYYLPGRAGYQAAHELIELAIENDHELFVASSSLSDFFYIVELALKREHTHKQAQKNPSSCLEVAWAFTNHLLEIATVVGSDSSDAWLASKYRSIHDDLEDNLVIAAAQRSKADFLISNDADLLKHSLVPSLCVADWIALYAKSSTQNTQG